MYGENGGVSTVKADLERFSRRSFEVRRVRPHPRRPLTNTHVDLQYVLEHIAGPSYSTAELPHKPFLIAIIRSSRMSSCHSRFPDGTTPSQPFFWLASQQCRVYVHLDMHDLLPPFFSYKLWHDLLTHKLLILATLDSYAATDRAFFNAKGIEALAHGLHQRTCWWLQDGMDTGEDELADALHDIGLIKYKDVASGPLPAGITPGMLNQCLPS